MNDPQFSGPTGGDEVWDASHAMAMRLRVDRLLRDAERAPGLAMTQLQELSDLVTTGRLAEADAAWRRLSAQERPL